MARGLLCVMYCSARTARKGRAGDSESEAYIYSARFKENASVRLLKGFQAHLHVEKIACGRRKSTKAENLTKIYLTSDKYPAVAVAAAGGPFFPRPCSGKLLGSPP